MATKKKKTKKKSTNKGKRLNYRSVKERKSIVTAFKKCPRGERSRFLEEKGIGWGHISYWMNNPPT